MLFAVNAVLTSVAVLDSVRTGQHGAVSLLGITTRDCRLGRIHRGIKHDPHIAKEAEAVKALAEARRIRSRRAIGDIRL